MLFNNSYKSKYINLIDLWEKTLGDARICIAVLDGPVDRTHPSLASADLTILKTLSSSSGSGPALEHGTHVASILFGRHGSEVKGIAPGCRGLIVPIFSDIVAGTPLPCSQVDLARAITDAVAAGANIVNVSGGQFSPSGTAHPILAEVVAESVRRGVLVVAAAGNQGCDCLHIPGSLPSVLAVGAMDSDGEPLPFSNWGEAYQSQGLLAPGRDVVGARPGGGIGVATGTSFATPIVSGVAALLMSLQLLRGRSPDATAVRQALLKSSLGCEHRRTANCKQLLRGRLNIRGAVSILSPGAPRMPDQMSIDPSSQPEAPQASEVIYGPSLPEGVEAYAGPAAEMGSISPSACGCGGNKATQYVYALGQLGFDFGTEARRDSLAQNMKAPAPNVPPNPGDPIQLLAYLQDNPWDAAALIWTIQLDATPIYAIQPGGPFAPQAYERLRQFFSDQLLEGAERVSIPGVIAGQTRLFNGQVLPVIQPDLRGMFNWSTEKLRSAVVGPQPKAEATQAEKANFDEKSAGVTDFLDRVYFELRNLGVDPRHRALNFAATNAFNVGGVFESALKDKERLELESVQVDRSPVCRPDSQCWDVILYLFFPQRQVQTVRKAFRFTVDVSDVVPVTVGPVRTWFVR